MTPVAHATPSNHAAVRVRTAENDRLGDEFLRRRLFDEEHVTGFTCRLTASPKKAGVLTASCTPGRICWTHILA